METIRIGTCVPGQATEKLLPHFVRAGFECVALNFHMEFPEKDLPTYWEKVRPLLEGSPGEGVLHRLLLQRPGKRGPAQDLGALYRQRPPVWHGCGDHFRRRPERGQPVEKAIPRYKEVFGELARRAEAKGVRLAIENCPMDGTWHKATCNIGFNPKAWEMMFRRGAQPGHWPGVGAGPPDGAAHRPAAPAGGVGGPRVPHPRQGRHPPLGQGAQVGRLWRWGSSRNPGRRATATPTGGTCSTSSIPGAMWATWWWRASTTPSLRRSGNGRGSCTPCNT